MRLSLLLVLVQIMSSVLSFFSASRTQQKTRTTVSMFRYGLEGAPVSRQSTLRLSMVSVPLLPGSVIAVAKQVPENIIQAVQSGAVVAKATKLSTWLKLSTFTSLCILFRDKITNKVSETANKMEGGWVKRGEGTGFSRTFELWRFAFKFAYEYLKVRKLAKGDQAIYSEGKKKLAELLRDKLLELGPTFIKLGQLLSTRIDVLPKEYINALVTLQDQVPGFPGEQAIAIIEQQLGKPIDQLYDNFNKTSLAAASLGQVHVAELNGKKVAIKIQRQGLKDLFDQDLKNIKVLAKLLDAFDPKNDGAQRDWVSIYDESARLLYREINYEFEALNCLRFKKNFEGTPWVKVPDVYMNMTTEKVITMEYVPGIKVNDIEKIEAAGINRELLAERSAQAYLTQICRHGFFHCDPHPGNVACNADMDGTLIFYDFGMMDELKPEVKSGLVNLIFSIYENDSKEACDGLEEMGILKKGVDRISIEKIAKIFLTEFNQGVKKGEKWVNQLSKDEQKEIRRQRRAQLGSDLFSVGSDVPFKFPPTFTFVFRAFTSLDGIGKGLDSGYDLTRLAQPFLKELVDLRDGSAFVSALKTFGKKVGLRPIDLKQAIMSPRNIAKTEDIISRMEQGDLKIRVRDLETTQSFKRLRIVQDNMSMAIAASACLNVGVILAALSPAGQMTKAAKAGLALAGIFGSQFGIGMIKLKSYDKKVASFD